MTDEPTVFTATYNEWYRALCEYARSQGGSTSTEQPWMRNEFNRFSTPSQAWDNFNNDEVSR